MQVRVPWRLLCILINYDIRERLSNIRYRIQRNAAYAGYVLQAASDDQGV
jgi:hypothetical protein